MGNDGGKLNKLYGMLDVMENNLPEKDIRSKNLIDNLKELNVNVHSDKSIEAKKKIEEIPEGIVSALNNLKKTIKLFNLDIEDEKVRQFKLLLERYIDEFVNLFNELQEEKDLIKRTELTVKIKEIYQNISTYMQP
ncbi:hypothetical protein C4588_07665 [Candidatus Parcubacteria bacterium]|nr:MAG: hypothetical protein C4588_07665 [Candidatus Parcubacteria bacterium]